MRDQDVLEDLPDRLNLAHADQLLVQPSVEIGQAVRVEAELVQDSCVQVFYVEWILYCGTSEFVSRADTDAPLDATAGQPHRKSVGVVVASGPFLILCRRLPPELPSPDDECRVE